MLPGVHERGTNTIKFSPRCLMYKLDVWSVIMHDDFLIGPTLVFMISIRGRSQLSTFMKAYREYSFL